MTDAAEAVATPAADAPATRLRLLDLRHCQCRWPLGRPFDRPEYFCGEPTRPGRSYCDTHRRVALIRSKQ